jgi:hypothetical protein
MPPKRTAFTVDEKIALRAHHAQYPSLSQKALCQWFEESFGKPIRQNTVSEVLSQRYSHINSDLEPVQRASKKQRLQAYPDLERALHHFFIQAQDKIIINDAVVRAKAQSLWHRLPQYHGLEEPLWSNGWLFNFKQRHKIKQYTRHGEAASVSEVDIAMELAQIQARVAQYAPADQYNCDETGLYWKINPDKSLSTYQLSGTKKQKDRITIHHACNATGSHKLPMWIIAKHKHPRCFKAAGLKSVEALGIRWRTNKKAWMVTGIMVEWLRWFDNAMSGRKVILLMDNFSAHEAAVSELEAMPLGSGLLNTEICWLPPNTTSRLQPLDQGIIASFKARYKKRWISYMLEQYEQGSNALQTMNILKAVQWSIRAWDEVTPTTIANCWSHSTINLSPSTTPNNDNSGIINDLRQQLVRLSMSNRIHEIMDVNALLNIPEEQVNDNCEDLEDHLVALYSPVEEEESDDEDVEVLPTIRPHEVLRLLQGIKIGEMQADDCNADYISWIERYERVVQRRQIDALKQAPIQSFFGASRDSSI